VHKGRNGSTLELRMMGAAAPWPVVGDVTSG
jgi:hypothetical protein